MTGTCGPWVGKGHLPSSSSRLLRPFSYYTPTEPWGCPRTAGGCLPPARCRGHQLQLQALLSVPSSGLAGLLGPCQPRRTASSSPIPTASVFFYLALRQPCLHLHVYPVLLLLSQNRTLNRLSHPGAPPWGSFLSPQLSQLVEETRSERHAILFCLTSPPLPSALNSSPLSFFSSYTQKLLLL